MGTATIEPTRRDTLNVGRRFTDEYLPQIEREIRGLRWGLEPSAPMVPGLGINAAIRELRIPKVSAYATNGSFTVPDGCETATYGVYGIEANYSNARVRIYIADTGCELVPLLVDVFEPPAEDEPSARDTIRGQRTVQLPDGREFAVVKGRRWTRVHEYLSNGQLTARWFVDESTGEAREAEGARKPRSWRLSGGAAELARWVVKVARVAADYEGDE